MKKLSKRMLSLVLSVLMVVTMLPTFVFSNPATAEASDVPSTDYWQIMASADFTTTGGATATSTSEGQNLQYKYKINSPTTSAGGSKMTWIKNEYWDDGAYLDTDGARFKNGFMFLRSIEGVDSNTKPFSDADNIKFDMTFSFYDDYKVTGRTTYFKNITFIKFSTKSDRMYDYDGANPWEYCFFSQEGWGRAVYNTQPNSNSSQYKVEYNVNAPYTSGNLGSREGNDYSISTQKLTQGAEYHYIMYYADGYLTSLVTDANGNVVIDCGRATNLSIDPSDITGIAIGNANGEYYKNIAVKNINIYKGVDTSTYDSTRNKYLLTYFTDNNDAGETLHYAVSSDGFNYEKVNNNGKVWNAADYTNGGDNSNIASYPTGGATSSIATSLHVRDPYVLRAQDGSYYILATDLNTNGGSVYSNGSKILVWHMNKLTDIPNTEPWVIDGTEWKAVIAENSDVKRMWAPQAIWDPAVGKYMLYFSAGTGSTTTNHTYMYYTYTTDFQTFTTPKRLIYDGTSNTIDGDITYYNGLYYMWYKREDSSNLAYAVAPNANGPYSNVSVFDEPTLALEGPSVFQLGENSYGMLADAYLDSTGYAKVCTASDPSGFTVNNSTNSNAASDFHYRHGCVTRITTEEYNELKTLVAGGVNYKWLGVDSQRFSWNGEFPFNDNGKANMTYKNAYCQGTMTANNGTLKFEDNVVSPAGSDQAGGCGVMLTNTDITDIISADQYTIDFTFKLGNDTTKYQKFAPENNTILAIRNGGTNYIRLAADGTFYVNGNACSPKANVSNSSSKRYTIVHNEYSTSLLVDGEYVCGRVDSTAIPSTSTVTLGWCDGDYTYYRITGEYGPLSITPTAISIGSENEYYDDLTDGVNATPKTFNGQAALYNSIDSDHTDPVVDDSGIVQDRFGNTDIDGFRNIVYAKLYSQDWEEEKDYNGAYYYFGIPTGTVLAYDGTNQPSMPVGFAIKVKSSSNQRIYYCDMPNSNCPFELRGYWRGFVSYGSEGYDYSSARGTLEYWYYSSSPKNDWNHNNTGTARFYANKMFYTGSGAGKDANYLETITNVQLRMATTRGNNPGNSYTSTRNGANYVINYKPIRDILTSTIPGSDLTASDLLNYNTNAWKYTPDSYAYALYALKMVAAINPNDTSKYDYSSDTGTAALQCGKDIKTAVEAFDKVKLVKNHFAITYNMVDNDVIVKSIEAGNSLSGTIPDHTATYHLDGTSKHRTGTGWEGTAPASSTVPHNPVSFTESGSDVDCTKTTLTVVDDTEDAGGAGHNGYDYPYCATCKHSYLDEKQWHEHDTEWTNYDGYVAKATVEGTYTTDSKTEYASQISSIIDGVTSHDETKSASYITGKNTALESAAETYLNPLAEYSTLLEHKTTRDCNNEENSKQKYTYDSWVAFASSYDAGKAVYDAKSAEQKLNIGKYQVDASNKVTSTKTAEQSAIETANDATNPAVAALKEVDSASAYETFDAAYAVVKGSLDPKKYTQSALNTINGVLNTADGTEYHTLTASEATAYNKYTDKSFSAGDKIKNATSETTDATTTGQTTAVLSAATVLNATENKDANINKYWVKFTIQDEDGNPLSGGLIDGKAGTSVDVYYGDTVTLSVPDSLKSSYRVSNWGTSNYDGDYTKVVSEKENPISTQKMSSRTSTVYEKTANGNVAVLAELGKESLGENEYRYNICDAYGSVIDAQFGTAQLTTGTELATVTINSKELVAKSMPLYKFSSWTVTYTAGNRTYRIVPVYDVEQHYDFTAVDGTVSTARQTYDKDVTVNYTGSDNFVAWAVKVGDKYQIASYSTTYKFFACADENYVPIIKEGTTYKVKTSAGKEEIHASNIDGAVQTVGSNATENDAIVYNKLDNKLPFIAKQNAIMTDGNTKARIFLRITQGSTGNTGFGVLYASGSGDAINAKMF
ncbi:MAG: glycoside hydrolase family 43 protein, partial [Eubacterium sp.]|nr:glycoside hydrolase family 43 protein [Eubacterium sp.]